MTDAKLTTAVEAYFKMMHDIRATGGATDERSYYPALTNLLNAVGGTLKPKVLCVSEMANQGAGHPDYGLYSATQRQKKKPQKRTTPRAGCDRGQARRRRRLGHCSGNTGQQVLGEVSPRAGDQLPRLCAAG